MAHYSGSQTATCLSDHCRKTNQTDLHHAINRGDALTEAQFCHEAIFFFIANNDKLIIGNKSFYFATWQTRGRLEANYEAASWQLPRGRHEKGCY